MKAENPKLFSEHGVVYSHPTNNEECPLDFKEFYYKLFANGRLVKIERIFLPRTFDCNDKFNHLMIRWSAGTEMWKYEGITISEILSIVQETIRFKNS